MENERNEKFYKVVRCIIMILMSIGFALLLIVPIVVLLYFLSELFKNVV